MATRYVLRRDTSADWADANPILALGEPGIEIDTHRLKIGDGVSAWASLPYFTDALGAAAAAQSAAQSYADGKVTAEVTRADGKYAVVADAGIPGTATGDALRAAIDAEIAAHGGTGSGGGLAATDNGDGTATLTATGGSTITDNGDGTAVLAA